MVITVPLPSLYVTVLASGDQFWFVVSQYAITNLSASVFVLMDESAPDSLAANSATVYVISTVTVSFNVLMALPELSVAEIVLATGA